MVTVYIDGQQVEAKPNWTILTAAKKAGISIPTLCWYKGLNDIAACRVCVVEVEGQNRLVASCNTLVEDGAHYLTKSKAALRARKQNVQLILSQHNTSCTTCVRSGNCTLQTLATDLNILDNPYEVEYVQEPWNSAFPLIRDSSKCIKCMRCIQVCDNIQGIHIWDLKNFGSRTAVGVSGNRKIENTECVLCGQCITHCPVGALSERDDIKKVMDAINDPEITTMVQVAPAVRTAWADVLGIPREEATMGMMANALRKLGFDYVFDTDCAADLTIMEEGSELLERLAHADEHKWPMFTSCCPAWVRYMKKHRPGQIKQLSTAKSPQQMFGSAAKALYGKKEGLAPEKIFCVSIMPCVAKKYECSVSEMWNVDEQGKTPDVDASLTTRELTRWIRMANIQASELVEDTFDNPMGEATGAGHIFGATGGVMIAALRTAYAVVVGKNPDPDMFSDMVDKGSWVELTCDLNGTPVRIAVASGLVHAEELLRALDAGEVAYDFVEIMSCPGGCAGGGGQPIEDGRELAGVRGDVLWKIDNDAAVRFSHENESVQQLYKEIFGKPLSELSEHLLHTDQEAWEF